MNNQHQALLNCLILGKLLNRTTVLLANQFHHSNKHWFIHPKIEQIIDLDDLGKNFAITTSRPFLPEIYLIG